MRSTSFGSARRRQTTGNNISQAFQGLIVWICTRPGAIVRWLTSEVGGQICLSLLMVYFLLVNIESYWQALGEEVFMPKPFISDGANFANIVRLLVIPSFWLTVMFVLALNAVSAIFFRDISISRARKKFSEVADEKVPTAPALGSSLDIAQIRHRQLKTAGMKRVRMAGFGVLICVTVDLICNYSGFPWWGSDRAFVLFVWWICSTFGFEVCGALLETKEERSTTDSAK